ncbi:hypothetical protein MTO96_020322 [Rhipicephalus appendiculatus]
MSAITVDVVVYAGFGGLEPQQNDKDAVVGAVLGDDSDSGDEADQQFKSKVYRMGLGRGYASAAAVKARAEQKSEEDSEAEIRARMRLMGLGRGKPLPRN